MEKRRGWSALRKTRSTILESAHDPFALRRQAGSLSPMQAWRFPLFLLFIGGLLASPAMAQSAGLKPSTAAVRAELVKVVQAQITAFRAGDYEVAYRLSAEAFRRQYSQVEFTRLVKAGYVAITTSTGADYGIARDDGTQAALPVTVEAGGHPQPYLYLLAKDPDGWRITGVIPQQPREPAERM